MHTSLPENGVRTLTSLQEHPVVLSLLTFPTQMSLKIDLTVPFTVRMGIILNIGTTLIMTATSRTMTAMATGLMTGTSMWIPVQVRLMTPFCTPTNSPNPKTVTCNYCLTVSVTDLHLTGTCQLMPTKLDQHTDINPSSTHHLSPTSFQQSPPEYGHLPPPPPSSQQSPLGNGYSLPQSSDRALWCGIQTPSNDHLLMEPHDGDCKWLPYN